MPKAHAKLPASGANRWMNCPGSIVIAEKVQQPESSSYAEEGTVAHTLAELKLRMLTGDISPKEERAEWKKITDNEYYCGEMEEATDFYADTIEETLAEAGKDAELMVEQQLDLSTWIPEGFGTSDAVIIGNDTIYVIDLKYGKGVRIDADNNPQLRLYALGAAEVFEGVYDFTQVKTMIIQPRLSHVSAEDISLADLKAWGDDVVKPAAEKAASGTEEAHPGAWCRFCPACAICRAKYKADLELARLDFAEPALLSNDEIGEALAKLEDLKRQVEALQEWALKEALAGHEIEGYKLVEGRSNRKYVDDLKVAAKLKEAGYAEELLYERKLLGITAMEKLVGKKKLTETLGDLIQKPPGKPVLVPNSDKREAIKNSVEEDFKEED